MLHVELEVGQFDKLTCKGCDISLKSREILVVDFASTFSTDTNSCNSQVIHASIYYLPNSLKALFA